MRDLLPIAILGILILTTGCKKSNRLTSNVTKIESGTNSRLNRITFLDQNTCIATGGERFLTTEVLRSSDDAGSFALSTYPKAGKAMYGMTYNSGTNSLLLIGVDGKTLYSSDKGKTWSIHQIPLWKFYPAAAYTSNKTCILISTAAQGAGNVIRIDSNFQVIDTAYFKFGLNDICMPTPQTGYIAAFGTILKTTDGGATWDYMAVKNDNFQSVFCLNEKEVWVIGYRGSIWHTSDGGANWNELRNGNNLFKKEYSLLDVYFKDSNTGWACGEKGLLIYTTDGGQNWTEYANFTKDALRAITPAPDGHLVMVGDNGGIYKMKP